MHHPRILLGLILTVLALVTPAAGQAPYLDGLHYTIIVERGTRVAALQAGQVDAAYPGEISVSIWEQLRAAVPRMVFTENYACGSARNYGDYCDEQVMRLIDQQSQETDPQKRLALVWQIQKRLEEDAARPTMGWRTDRFAHHPHVKNLVPHNVTYNWARHQETWLDR